jgi:hypothetical protein
MYRIKGVGQDYSDLLEETGVDTIVEISKRIPDNLNSKLLEVNKKKKRAKRLLQLSSEKLS